jgi:hypothetical protein
MRKFSPPMRLERCVLPAAAALLSLAGLAGALPGVSATPVNAAGLECPEVGQPAVPDLTTDPVREKLLLGESGADLANEIGDLIEQLRVKQPHISNADLTNGLVAAYCRLVAQAPGLTSAQRWSRMHRFLQVVQQQLATNELPPGSMILVEVPLQPAVYNRLKSQAAAAAETPTQLMASILAQAAGK